MLIYLPKIRGVMKLFVQVFMLAAYIYVAT